MIEDRGHCRQLGEEDHDALCATAAWPQPRVLFLYFCSVFCNNDYSTSAANLVPRPGAGDVLDLRL
jgi:hypothetical protein